MNMNPRIRIAVRVAPLVLAGIVCGWSGLGALEREPVPGVVPEDLVQRGWSGTVVVRDEAGSEIVDDNGVCCKTTTTTTLSNKVVFTVTNGSVVSTVDYSSLARVEGVQSYDTHKEVSLKTEETTATGTNRTESRISVHLSPDGSYEIQYRGGGVPGEYKMQATAVVTCSQGVDPKTCRPESTKTQDAGQPPNQGVVEGSVEGQINPKQPAALVGSSSESLELGANSSGKRTVTWNLTK